MMKQRLTTLIFLLLAGVLITNCDNSSDQSMSRENITAADILGNPEYQAISYGGYRENNRDVQPTIEQLKDDMLILNAMGVKVLRTYNVHFDHASNLLDAIEELKAEDPEFEMYVMLGAWIEAKYAFTSEPDRIRNEDGERYMAHIDRMNGNVAEMERAVELIQEHPDVVKVLAVGNEAMVHWAWEYYVEPSIILKWVNYAKDLRDQGELPEDLWITSSDNFASWGGGGEEYHIADLEELIKAVDFLSVHTYPMHDTHYNPDFWGVRDDEVDLTDIEKIDAAMQRSLEYSISQFNSVKEYMNSLGIDKPMHIGETGWATISNEFYGAEGAKAIDEYKFAAYYDKIREWSDENGVSVFYFEAFDERWKDSQNPEGSENHFGLINLDNEAKYALWDLVDEGVFDGLTRDGKPITKTFGGDKDAMMETVLVPPTDAEIQAKRN